MKNIFNFQTKSKKIYGKEWKHALITGASSGIGFELAKLFAKGAGKRGQQ